MFSKELDDNKLRINQSNSDNENLRNQLNRLSQDNE